MNTKLIVITHLSLAFGSACGGEVLLDPGRDAQGGGGVGGHDGSATVVGTGVVSVSASTTTTSGGSTGATGGSVFLPCFGDEDCAVTEFCDYPDDACGQLEAGICATSSMLSCTDQDAPVCLCDGTIAKNTCTGAMKGVDTSRAGCTAPPGTFFCGVRVCDAATEYCELSPGSSGYAVPECKPIPAACVGDATCVCLQGLVACGETCTMTQEGHAEVVCP